MSPDLPADCDQFWNAWSGLACLFFCSELRSNGATDSRSFEQLCSMDSEIGYIRALICPLSIVTFRPLVAWRVHPKGCAHHNLKVQYVPWMYRKTIVKHLHPSMKASPAAQPRLNLPNSRARHLNCKKKEVAACDSAGRSGRIATFGGCLGIWQHPELESWRWCILGSVLRKVPDVILEQIRNLLWLRYQVFFDAWTLTRPSVTWNLGAFSFAFDGAQRGKPGM